MASLPECGHDDLQETHGLEFAGAGERADVDRPYPGRFDEGESVG